ncbi:MAG TPA: CBS domain-containing protein [Thermoanaerobaculia bacterium]|nr:CBS domain-containing protein [Thermoanaerobaculia bacterium]
MRVRDIMKTRLMSIRPDEPVETARVLMRQNRVRHLVVLDNQELVGVLSDRDVIAPDQDSPELVSDRMTRTVVTITPDATIREAANIIRGKTISCLPVVKGDELLGIITVSDLLDLIGKGAVHSAKSTERKILKARGQRFQHPITAP